MKTYKFHLIRHGLTEANEKGIYCGSGTDLPLSEEGRSELRRLADETRYPYVDAVFTSPLLRARESAEILFPECETVVCESITEASFGRFEGRSLEELKHDEEFCRWAAPKSGFVPEGVEPAESFFRRVVDGFVGIVNEAMSKGMRSCAVVTHVDVISLIMAALAYPKAEPYEWNPSPGCGYTVLADPTLFFREPVVEATAQVPMYEGEGEDSAFADDYTDD